MSWNHKPVWGACTAWTGQSAGVPRSLGVPGLSVLWLLVQSRCLQFCVLKYLSRAREDEKTSGKKMFFLAEIPFLPTLGTFYVCIDSFPVFFFGKLCLKGKQVVHLFNRNMGKSIFLEVKVHFLFLEAKGSRLIPFGVSLTELMVNVANASPVLPWELPVAVSLL